MKSPGEILLVSCYELGHQPLGVAWPKAFLERSGFHPTVLDLSTDPLDDERIQSARLVAISTPMHTALALGVRAAERVRMLNPSAHIVFLGLYAVLNQRVLVPRLADSVLGGELEGALVALAESLATSRRPNTLDDVALKVKLDFPPPSRNGLPGLERYARLVHLGRERLAGAVEATRGCLHLCRHCPIPPVYGGRIFAVREEVVLADIAALAALGAEHITFSDPDFLNAPSHARRIARALHHTHPELTFDFTAKVEHLIKNADLLAELARHGALFVVSAVESLSDRVLEILDKGHTRTDVYRALHIARKARLTLRPSLLPFTPWSTLDDYLELLELIAAEDLIGSVDPVQLTVRLLVPPGSLLERHPQMIPHLGSLMPEALGWSWKHPDPRMDALQHAVSAIAEREGAVDPARTFELLWEAAATEVGSTAVRPAFRRPQTREVPRLTEPWFC